MFLRGETYKSSANVSSTTRPNFHKFLFKVKKGDQVQYNPPLRTIDLSNAQALPHFPKPAKRKQSEDGIIKRWSLRRSSKGRRSVDSLPPKVSRTPSITSPPQNFVKRWSLKRSNKRLSAVSSDWSAMDEPEEGCYCVSEQIEANTVHTNVRRWSTVSKQKSLPASTERKLEDEDIIEENEVVKVKQTRSLRLKPVVEKRASWRLSLQDHGCNGANKACCYLQDTAEVSPSEEFQALKRTLSGAQFYKDNSALKFLFPETDPTPTSRLGSLIRRTSSRKSQLMKEEGRSLKRWKKIFMGVNKRFVLKHLVSGQKY